MARPRKIVVVYSRYPDLAGMWVYKVNLQPHFKAMAVTTPAQLAHQYEPSAGVVPEGLILCVDTVDAAEPLLRQIPADTSGIVVSSDEEVIHYPTFNTGHHFLLTGRNTAAVFELLKEATTRKRGPRPGSHKRAPDVQVDEAAL